MRLARVHNLRTVLIAAAVLVGSIIVAGGVAFWWRRATATISVTVPSGEVIASCPANAVQVYDGQRMCPAWIALDRAGVLAAPVRR